jgi:hypothetical protein
VGVEESLAASCLAANSSLGGFCFVWICVFGVGLRRVSRLEKLDMNERTANGSCVRMVSRMEISSQLTPIFGRHLELGEGASYRENGSSSGKLECRPGESGAGLSVKQHSRLLAAFSLLLVPQLWKRTIMGSSGDCTEKSSVGRDPDGCWSSAAAAWS